MKTSVCPIRRPTPRMKRIAAAAGVCGLLSLLVYSTTGHAQSGRAIHLQDAIRVALEQHPSILATKARIDIARGDAVSAGARPNPSLVITGENFPLSPTERGYSFTRNTDWFAYVTHTIERGHKRERRSDVAQIGVDLALEDVKAVEELVVIAVTTAYERALAARTRLTLAREGADKFLGIVSYNQVRVTEGYTPEGDLIKAKLESQRLNYLASRLKTDYDKAKLELLRAMGNESFDLAFDLAESVNFRPTAINFTELQRLALQRPAMRIAEEQVRRAEAGLQLERAKAKQDIQTSLGYKRSGTDNTLYGAIHIGLPVFDRNEGGIQRAQSEVDFTRASVRRVHNEILGELALAQQAIENTERQLTTLQQDFLQRADESSAVAEAAYREGAADLLILLESQRARLTAQELFTQALLDYRMAIHELERAAGVRSLPLVAEGEEQHQPGRDLTAPVRNGGGTPRE